MVKKILIFCLILVSAVINASEVQFSKLIDIYGSNIGTPVRLDNNFQDFSVEFSTKKMSNKEFNDFFEYTLFNNQLNMKYNPKLGAFVISSLSGTVQLVNNNLNHDLNNSSSLMNIKNNFGFNDDRVPLDYKTYIYPIKHISNGVLSDVLSVRNDVKYKYLSATNQIVFSCPKEKKKEILELLQKTDIKINQKLVKVTFISSTDTDLKDVGNHVENGGLSFNFDDMLTSTNDDVSYTINNSIKFNAVIKFLSEKKLIHIEQEPTLLLRNGIKTSLQSVQNIPYLQSTTTTDSTVAQQQNNYNYKDVGLKIDFTPYISKNSIYIDFEITNEDLLDSSVERPITNKVFYKNSLQINDKPVLITGINKNIKSKINSGIPLLKDIPFLGKVFGFDNVENKLETISILFEVIPNTKDN